LAPQFKTWNGAPVIFYAETSMNAKHNIFVFKLKLFYIYIKFNICIATLKKNYDWNNISFNFITKFTNYIWIVPTLVITVKV